MNINWKVRFNNKLFWLTIVPALLLLAQQILALFGIQFDAETLSGQIAGIINTVFAALAALGVVTDLTTVGVNDSTQAMTYVTPKVSEKTDK